MWRAWFGRPQRGEASERDRVAALLLPHLDAAYNLARWLMRDANQAEDVVQDAMVKALAGAAGYRGGDPRAWLLRIVRTTAYDTLSGNRQRGEVLLEDELPDPSADAETLAAQREALVLAGAMVENLPLEWREALVLRELEGLSYREIAEVTQTPIGTVMSRLSRARQCLLEARAAGQTG